MILLRILVFLSFSYSQYYAIGTIEPFLFIPEVSCNYNVGFTPNEEYTEIFDDLGFLNTNSIPALNIWSTSNIQQISITFEIGETNCVDFLNGFEYPAQPAINILSYELITTGCTDPDANNFDSYATEDDGSCLYECEEENPAGCFTNGCQENYDCVDDWEYYCVPTSCGCDENYGEWFCTEDCNGGSCISQDLKGDFNHDEQINVVDIVQIVNHILGGDYISYYQQWASDINEDGAINIVDIVLLVNIILNVEPETIFEIGDSLYFSLEDLNISSETFGFDIGPQDYIGKVVLVYFTNNET